MENRNLTGSRGGCIDAGREGCPCALAQYGKCIVCGRLSGGTCNDCNWQGSCIFSIYQQNGRSLVKARGGQRLEIEEVKVYSETFKVFVLKASKGFCQKASMAGTYVFARSSEADIWSDMPVSVLKSEPEKGRLHLGICGCGPKSADIINEEKELYVRGVYYNALSGMSMLTHKPDVTAVYAKGIAIAPLRNLLDGGTKYRKWLTNMKLFMDIDKVGMDFFADYFGDISASSVEILEMIKGDIPVIGGESSTVNVIALTSPYYAEKIEELYGRKVTRPTKGNMCCGEGMCGACTFDDENGKTIHGCKARY